MKAIIIPKVAGTVLAGLPLPNGQIIVQDFNIFDSFPPLTSLDYDISSMQLPFQEIFSQLRLFDVGFNSLNKILGNVVIFIFL